MALIREHIPRLWESIADKGRVWTENADMLGGLMRFRACTELLNSRIAISGLRAIAPIVRVVHELKDLDRNY
jgi:hypothetical protein